MKHFFSSASSSSSSSHSHPKQKRSVVYHGAKLHKCDLCGREFTTGNALGGHKAFHNGNNFLLGKINKQKHADGIKIETSHSCVRCSKTFSCVNALNGHMKLHSQYGSTSKKGSKNYDQDQFPPIDLRKYLPPMRYVTKKRSWNYVNDVEADVAEAMLDMSERSPNNLDGNHRVRRRIKLRRNVDKNGKIKEQGGVLVKHCVDETIVRDQKNKVVARLKIPNGLVIQNLQASNQPASNDDNEENNNTGEDDETDKNNNLPHELGLNVVRDFDLNELPVEDDADETAH